MIRFATSVVQLLLVGVVVWWVRDLWRTRRRPGDSRLHAHVVDLEERRRRAGVAR